MSETVDNNRRVILQRIKENNIRMCVEMDESLKIIADEVKFVQSLKGNIKENKAFILKEEEALK